MLNLSTTDWILIALIGGFLLVIAVLKIMARSLSSIYAQLYTEGDVLKGIQAALEKSILC